MTDPAPVQPRNTIPFSGDSLRRRALTSRAIASAIAKGHIVAIQRSLRPRSRKSSDAFADVITSAMRQDKIDKAREAREALDKTAKGRKLRRLRTSHRKRRNTGRVRTRRRRRSH